jgi:hypothetical protein
MALVFYWCIKIYFMKPYFITLDSLDETEDGTVTINTANITTIRRMNYNDTVQTMIQMIGGERFGVSQTPVEIAELVSREPTY